MAAPRIVRVNAYTFSLSPVDAKDVTFEIPKHYNFDYPGPPWTVPIPQGSYDPKQLAKLINLQSPEYLIVHYDGDEFQVLRPPGVKKSEFQLIMDHFDRTEKPYYFRKVDDSKVSPAIRVILVPGTKTSDDTPVPANYYAFNEHYNYLGSVLKNHFQKESFEDLKKRLATDKGF
jgi:hypothetical protein